MRSQQEPWHALAGAYTLDAVDEVERLGFEDHLGRCPECTWEVWELAEAAARLGEGLAQAPPPRIRRRVMEGVRRSSGRFRAPVSPVSPVSAVPRSRPARKAGRWTQVTRGLAAASLAAAVVLGVVTVRTQDLLERSREDTRRIASVLAAPDARSVTGTAEGGGGGGAVVSREQDRLVFVPSGLEELPEGRTYQLWRIGSSGITSAGLLRSGESGELPPVVVEGIGGTESMGVTVEPAGGSWQPTSTPLLLLELPAS
ncbi:anti-sigma factor [Planobispora rosea]|uniref:anti-sigma factor n=1 Tax=Planobispora rosea TaxID=35762 RepID=UPI00083A1BDA|nr:anti-sigma factor [Planobispora rosea]